MSKNRLIIEMAIFTAFLFVSFSLIIINEKSKEFLLPKVDKKLDVYIDKEFSEIKNEIKIQKTKYNKKKELFEKKIENKNNKNLYFIVSYKNKKIKSSYKKDYVEGKTLLTKYERDFKNNLENKKYNIIKIKFTKNLNKYNTLIQEKLISNQDVQKLNIYTLYTTLNSKTFDKSDIIYTINNFYKYLNKKEYNPKFYNITILNSEEITKEINIKNLNTNLVKNNLEEIISGIIKEDQTIKSKFNIDYKYNN